MAKKTAKTDSATASTTDQPTESAAGVTSSEPPAETSGSGAPPVADSLAIKAAIANGQALIAEGKSKADAARAIYAAISSESKDTIVAAFVEGATLTPKGALTYWYNNRRKAAKESKET